MGSGCHDSIIRSVGDQLPTVRELVAELRVNFNTVARAYRMLDEAGLISTQRGQCAWAPRKTEQLLQDTFRRPEATSVGRFGPYWPAEGCRARLTVVVLG